MAKTNKTAPAKKNSAGRTMYADETELKAIREELDYFLSVDPENMTKPTYERGLDAFRAFKDLFTTEKKDLLLLARCKNHGKKASEFVTRPLNGITEKELAQLAGAADEVMQLTPPFSEEEYTFDKMAARLLGEFNDLTWRDFVKDPKHPDKDVFTAKERELMEILGVEIPKLPDMKKVPVSKAPAKKNIAKVLTTKVKATNKNTKATKKQIKKPVAKAPAKKTSKKRK